MDDKKPTPSEQPSLDEQINKALANTDDKGKIQFSDEVEPLFKRVVLAEKKARDNQASFTKSRQEIAELKATKEVLETSIVSSTRLTAEQAEELDELKFTDPDSWFQKKMQYEQDAKATMQGKLNEKIDEASAKAVQDLTLTQRQDMLANFQASTGIILTDDVMANDIPPRLQNKIGSMPFEDYLQEVATYLGKAKVIKPTEETPAITNIGTLAGTGETAQSKPKKYQIL